MSLWQWRSTRVRQAGDVAGKDICVLGAGPIGILVAQAAKGLGARKVMVTDVSDIRLEKAKECGADVCVNTRKEDSAQARLSSALARTRPTSSTTARGITSPWARPLPTPARAAPSSWWPCLFPGHRPGGAQRPRAGPEHLHDVPQRGLPGRHRAGEPGKVQLKPLISKHFCFSGLPEGLPVHRREP